MIGTMQNEELLSGMNFFQQSLLAGSQKLDDIYCLGLLQSIMMGYDFVPFTVGALRPFCLVHILNDIVVNNRKNIVEFGSGLSTILIGRLIKKNALNARLLSVEQNREWANVLTKIIKNDGASDVIDIVYAPLTETEVARDGSPWYDVNVLNEQIAEKRFDMVIIDGPTAWQTGNERARYPALPYIINKLEKTFCIYSDDADRLGERSILQLWQKEYEIEFTILGGTLAYFATDESFCAKPV